MQACPTCRKRPASNHCGLLVFVGHDCPVCLEAVSPVVALPCGHTVCQDCFQQLGGALPPNPSNVPLPAPAVAQSVIPQPARNVRQRVQELQALWVHCKTDGVWRLWRVTAHQERNMFAYPEGSTVVGDGRRGVWALCSTRVGEESSWRLWHATQQGEHDLYQYPKESQLVGDGRGGVWVLCSTRVGEESQMRLWHANDREERDMYEYPAGSKLVGDGCGGVWVLCSTRIGDESSWRLWHANDSRERDMFAFPKGSILIAP